MVILGSGNLAWSLAPAIARLSEEGNDIKLLQLYSRNREEGAKLAQLAGVPYTGSSEKLAEADLYIMTVADGAVTELSGKMIIPSGAVVAHTAGSTGIDAISPRINNRGVLYPLQTFTKGREVDFSQIPLFIEYTTPRAEEVIRYLAGKLSGNVSEASSEIREKIHLAAVFAANFTNHMYVVAEEILKSAGLPFDTVKPLIGEVAAKAVASRSPAETQTGPAVRGDMTTVNRHLELLANDKGMTEEYAELLRKIYETISQSIWETSKKK